MISSSSLGTLHLIPTPLGKNAPLEVLPLTIKKAVEELDHFIVENEKNARAFIKNLAPQKNQESITLYLLNKYTNQLELESFLDPAKEGISMGLLSDAGCPSIADPGAVIVKQAHQLGIPVKPLVGPSSLLLALMASGMNGQNFAFNGYLPIDKTQRIRAIKQFEKKTLKEKQAQLFIETPYRNTKLFDDFLKHLAPQTLLCVACDLTLETSFIKTYPIALWKKNKPDLHKRPTLFILDQD